MWTLCQGPKTMRIWDACYYGRARSRFAFATFEAGGAEDHQ
jgi:hypothetical protein